jgi:XTP/dITP diphosphohydrolase
MGKQILMATSNPHKKERFQHYLKELSLNVIGLADLDEKIEVVEDGKTPEENALKKAMAGFETTGKPTFGVDYWFYIEGLPAERQPCQYVRRIFVGEAGERKDATDDEMLEYYSKLVKELGGKTDGLWVSAIALITSKGKEFVERFERKTILTSKINPKRTPGEPLNSIQIDPTTGKYFTDLTKKEWLELQTNREKSSIDFIKSHLDDI